MMSKRRWKTRDTARKSTATSSEVRRTPTRTLDEFSRAEERIRTKIEARRANESSATYRGPVGIGRGKGAIRRVRRSVTRQLEIRTSMSPVSRPEPEPAPPRSPFMRGDDVPLAQFARYVKHLLDTNFAKLPNRYRFQVAAIEAMKVAFENYAVLMFETSNMLVQHCGRVTVMTKDLALYKRVEQSQTSNIDIAFLHSAIMSSQDKKPRSYYVDYTKTKRYGNNKRAPQAGVGGTNNARFREAPDFGQGGQRGFLITSVDEVKSYLEMRNVLEQYYHELYDTHDNKESEEKDLTTEDELESELKHLRITRPFKQIRTHCKNSIFLNIVTNFEHVDPVLIIDRFFDGMAEEQTNRTGNTFKVLPILDTFRNNVASAKEAITKLLEERFQDQGAKNYFIEFQTRGNYKLESEDKQRMIEGVAEAVAQSRPNWQVNRDNVHYMIVLVALKNICCLSVVQNYFKRSKYNVIEFCKSFTEPSSEVPATIEQAKSVVEVQKE